MGSPFLDVYTQLAEFWGAVSFTGVAVVCETQSEAKNRSVI